MIKWFYFLLELLNLSSQFFKLLKGKITNTKDNDLCSGYIGNIMGKTDKNDLQT